MTGPTRVGVVGAGQIATTMHIPVLTAMNDTEIAWIADADEVRGGQVASFWNCPFASVKNGVAGLPSCDAVLLAIPLAPREDFFCHYARTETAVFAEKPLVITAIEHEKLAKFFPPWQVAVGYQRRYYAINVLLKQIVQAETFGGLRMLRINEGGRVMRTGGGGGYQDLPASQGGGIVRNLGSHSLDLALWLTGAENFEIKRLQIEWDGEVDRKAEATILLESGQAPPDTNSILEWSVSWLDALANNIELVFDNATLRASISPASQIELMDRKGKVISHFEATTRYGAQTSSQAFYLEWCDALESAAAKRSPMQSVISTLHVARLMDRLLLG